MIPKIIHYCWFGGKDKPDEFHRWFEGWKELLPDYEFMEWNERNFDIRFCDYSREAYLTGNYAHVSDVCRVYALHRFGGVYLDTDVEVLKSFDPYLCLGAFASIECPLVGTAVIGSEPGAPWLTAFLDYYRHTHFINIWGHTVRTPNTKILTLRVLPKIPLADWPTIFPRDFFCGQPTADGTPSATVNTVAIHHFAASWRKKKTIGQKISSIAKGFKIRYFQK